METALFGYKSFCESKLFMT